MCTVTFLPVEDGIYLTSNRDEHFTRGRAVAPQRYVINGCNLVFPKDVDKGGSWIASKDNGDVAVLLNGAFTKHIAKPPYRESRGMVLLEVLCKDSPLAYFNECNLIGIEPFTLILYTKAFLFECRWTGTEKHQQELNVGMSYIWSSSTLYDEKVVVQRQKWFDEWKAVESVKTVKDIVDFHRFGGTGNSEADLVMNREGRVMTVSITYVAVLKGESKMTYFDLQQSPEAKEREVFQWFRRLAIRIFNWEYWPLEVVYAPVMLYWFWLSLKARSFFFFSAANPLILNAGFAMGRKSSIYELMSGEYYPKTQLCHAGEEIDVIRTALEARKLRYPLIAKPDIGERGVQVRLLQTEKELKVYLQDINVDFLVQEYIDYTLEAGIFYYRIPGETKGWVSGIVGKEFLEVKGDGISTIEMLLMKEDRYFLQFPVLKQEYGASLNQVLPAGISKKLMPYGSHSRGAKFVDHSCMINEQLRGVIDQLCQKVPEFYYGRLDVKFKSWEDLYKGKHFAVIEVNGAASEPTHMYDPVHSIFFAWKEIIRHWHLLYKISRKNAKQKGLPLMGTAEGLQMIRDHSAYLKMMV